MTPKNWTLGGKNWTFFCVFFFGGEGIKNDPQKSHIIYGRSQSAPEHRVRLTSGRACALRLTLM